MKNILKFLPALLLLTFVFTACEEDEIDNVPSTVIGSAVKVANADGLFDLGNLANSSFQFDVSTIGEDVTAVDMYKSYNGGARVLHTTLNQLPANIVVTAAEAMDGLGITESDLAIGDAFTFSFDNVRTGSGAYPSGTTIDAPVSCISNLAGMYDVSTTYGYHDFLPDFETHTMVSEIVEVAAGTYSIADFSGGLYSVGPYVAAYGTAGIPAEFSDVCGQLSWIDQADDWGAMIPAVGGVNSVDPTTGIITISWYCEAYGENGISIYTPQ